MYSGGLSILSSGSMLMMRERLALCSVGGDARMSALGVRNFAGITMDGLDSVALSAATIKSGRMPILDFRVTVIKWLSRLLNVCIMPNVVPFEWLRAALFHCMEANEIRTKEATQ